MALVDLIIALALLQLAVFGTLVGRARGRYSVKAPAVTGHEQFERYYRVQLNTIELLVMFVPACWLAARYVAPVWIGLLGGVYLLGRLLYLRAYVREPSTRGLGFVLSFLPTIVLMLIGLVGAGLALAKS
ncbi:MAG: hypothetical protein NVS9B10_01730 [Nevskia sp.]